MIGGYLLRSRPFVPFQRPKFSPQTPPESLPYARKALRGSNWPQNRPRTGSITAFRGSGWAYGYDA